MTLAPCGLFRPIQDPLILTHEFGVTPADAGVQGHKRSFAWLWTPAFAG
jgi:hypothetical protein